MKQQEANPNIQRGDDVEKIETREEVLEDAAAPESTSEEPSIAEDICVEELAIDGICGVY